MALEKIKESDLSGKGVLGQAEVPGLSALEMQAAVEQIVREIAIPKINEVIEYIAGKVATQEDLGKLLIEAGTVTSVFGRAGAVKAQKGDYTAEMVGAAKTEHAREHALDGSDPILPANIGAAERNHAHGSISADGKIGNANGMVLMTGLGGKIEAKAKNEAGFVVPPVVADISGSFTAEDNRIYFGNGISDFVFSCDEGKTAECRGFITFGVPGTISLSGFDYIDDPEDISLAEEGSRWEFDLSYGCLIIRRRSE
ncbi:MAG: hypothetical protein IJA70_00945 [Oscillospiraceae bacterium]|nr:hypothetical protein [Oscillospiraceae bacterium]MBQ4642839.1 hypothetical protein [Oscillospiraceae bacterium]